MNHEEIMQQLKVGVQHYQDEDLDRAEAIFKQILAFHGTEPNALHFLGCIYKERGQLQLAIDFIKKSIRVDASNPLCFLNLGKIFFLDGQYQEAFSCFRESLERNNQIYETWFCYGNTLRMINKIQEAIKAYQNALLRSFQTEAMQIKPRHSPFARMLLSR